MDIRVVTLNIQYSLGPDGIYDLERSLTAVRSADVICLQEVERNWRHSAMEDQPARIEALFPDRYCAFAPVLDVDASERNPDGTIVNRRRQFGQMTLSRFPILSSRTIQLPKIDTGPMPNSWAAAHEMVLGTPDGPVRLMNVHLADVSETNRMTQVWALVEHLARVPIEGGAWNGTDDDAEVRDHWQLDDPASPMPVAAIVVGDFNDEPHSAVLDVMYRAGYHDSWSTSTALSPGWATFKTNPAQGTYTDMRIDFILVNAGVKVIDAEIDVDCVASDHQPVWATVALQ